jgi:predicted RNA-binding Zn ribbon-like protein
MTGTKLVRDFVNTRELLEPTESFDSPEALGAWLLLNGLTPEDVRPGPADLRRAVELREALRRILLSNTGLDMDTEAEFAVLDDVASRAQVELHFGDNASRLVPGSTGSAAALGRIVVAVHDAMADGSWSRLKACRASDCEWAFIDSAKNHSRQWCSMGSCGNREKARAFRERHRHH